MTRYIKIYTYISFFLSLYHIVFFRFLIVIYILFLALLNLSVKIRDFISKYNGVSNRLSCVKLPYIKKKCNKIRYIYNINMLVYLNYSQKYFE